MFAAFGVRIRPANCHLIKNTVMKIHLQGEWATRQVRLNGRILSPAKSQKVWNHSPDGFNWGYGGSGPAQLALAICLQLYGPKGKYDHQDFKFKYIATLPQYDFDVELEVPDKDKVEAY